MSSIEIKLIGITDLDTDCIVNAANSHLAAGSGVCGAIFRAAGHQKLQAACDKIGYCPTGGAVITPGFALKAKYIVHAVGPIWHGGDHHEPEDLYSCYQESLNRAKENDCHSIGFPLISAGIFGYPKDKAWRKALQSCNDWLKANPGYDMDIVFAVLDHGIFDLGNRTMAELGINAADDKIDREVMDFCSKYIPILQMIDDDPDLKLACSEHSAYEADKKHGSVINYLYRCFMKEAYKSGVVISDYREVVENAGMTDKVGAPSDEDLAKLTAEQILGCIAWHFRRDHFAEGSLVAESIADGHMLRMLKAYEEK